MANWLRDAIAQARNAARGLLALRTAEFSLDALLVVLELHDEGLDVLALSLPVGDGVFGVGVEVLLLLVDKGLGLEGVDLLLLELPDGALVLYVGLRVLEVGQFSGPLPLLFALLLLSQLQLFVADFPELGEVFVLADLGAPLGRFPLDLELTASLDGGLHLGLPLLLLLVESVRSVFSLGHLPVQHFFLVVLQRAQLFDLAVDHALASLLFISKALHFSLLLHVLESFTLLSEGFDLNLFFNLLTTF